MSSAGTPQGNRRRGSNDPNKKACNRCRHRKTRCDGMAPLRCSFCVSRGETCEYAEAEKKIPVPESIYHALMAGQFTISPKTQHHDPEDEDVNDSLPENMPPNIIRGASGKPTYRGEGSSINWALLFQDLVNPRSKNFDRELQMEYPFYSDPTWLQRGATPTKAKLPPYDTAKRLYHAQYLYIGTIFCFCPPQDFERRLDWVYFEDPELSHREVRLAYCQILLIFAYGLLYSLNQWSGDDGPPGFIYFKKALEFLPDVHEEGSILFVEVLSLVGYYLQNLNRRDAAFLYVRTLFSKGARLTTSRSVWPSVWPSPSECIKRSLIQVWMISNESTDEESGGPSTAWIGNVAGYSVANFAF
jgi:proline utilization trans-activator